MYQTCRSSSELATTPSSLDRCHEGTRVAVARVRAPSPENMLVLVLVLCDHLVAFKQRCPNHAIACKEWSDLRRLHRCGRAVSAVPIARSLWNATSHAEPTRPRLPVRPRDEHSRGADLTVAPRSSSTRGLIPIVPAGWFRVGRYATHAVCVGSLPSVCGELGWSWRRDRGEWDGADAPRARRSQWSALGGLVSVCQVMHGCRRRSRWAVGRALHRRGLEACGRSGRARWGSELCVMLVDDGVHGHWSCHDGNRVGLALCQCTAGRALEWSAVVDPAARHPVQCPCVAQWRLVPDTEIVFCGWGPYGSEAPKPAAGGAVERLRLIGSAGRVSGCSTQLRQLPLRGVVRFCEGVHCGWCQVRGVAGGTLERFDVEALEEHSAGVSDRGDVQVRDRVHGRGVQRQWCGGGDLERQQAVGPAAG